MMAVIFAFSMGTGTESGGLSSTISAWLHIPEIMVRKMAHVTEFLLLTLCAILALRKAHGVTPFKTVIIAGVIAVVYASTDEIHQLFVNGRHGCFTDVLVDSIGVVIACTLYFFINKILVKNIKN